MNDIRSQLEYMHSNLVANWNTGKFFISAPAEYDSAFSMRSSETFIHFRYFFQMPLPLSIVVDTAKGTKSKLVAFQFYPLQTRKNKLGDVTLRKGTYEESCLEGIHTAGKPFLEASSNSENHSYFEAHSWLKYLS